MKKNIIIIALILFIGWTWLKPVIETWYWMYYQSSAHVCWYDTDGDDFPDAANNIGKVKTYDWNWKYMQPEYHTICPKENN